MLNISEFQKALEPLNNGQTVTKPISQVLTLLSLPAMRMSQSEKISHIWHNARVFTKLSNTLNKLSTQIAFKWAYCITETGSYIHFSKSN